MTPTPPTLDLSWVTSELAVGGRFPVERLERGEKVLIHCKRGVGRSALMTLCVLVAGGRSPLEALALAQAGRRQLYPNTEQLEAFQEFAREWKRTHAVPWTVPGMKELLLSALHAGWLPPSD